MQVVLLRVHAFPPKVDVHRHGQWSGLVEISSFRTHLSTLCRSHGNESPTHFFSLHHHNSLVHFFQRCVMGYLAQMRVAVRYTKALSYFVRDDEGAKLSDFFFGVAVMGMIASKPVRTSTEESETHTILHQYE